MFQGFGLKVGQRTPRYSNSQNLSNRRFSPCKDGEMGRGGRGEKDEALWLVPAFLLHVRTARGSVGARESLHQSSVDALHFVLKHAERHQDKDRLWGVARRGQMCRGREP
jgi:hypothetical protein